MAQLIDQILNSGLFAQSAYSAAVATKDELGRDITATYITGVSIPESATWNEVSTTVQSNSAQWAEGGSFPTSANEVCETVQTNSGVWDETSNTVQTNSAQWSQGEEGGDAVVLIPGSSPLSSLSAAISANKEIVLNKAGRYYRYDSSIPTPFGSDTLFYKIGTNRDVALGRTKQLNRFETVVIRITNLTDVIPDPAINTIPLIADWNENDSYLPSFIKNKPDLSNSGLWNEISAYQEASASYLTAVDLTPYQTTAEMTAYQPTLTFGYDEQDRISAINSSALAGGGDVPEDVMVEPNLEYNAVGEISGYGSSAIAQYGAEKQWLVHDSTLCHLSNSAQYALGCNISALQRLMGIDETVLWSGADQPNPGENTDITYTLNEPMTNFDEIKVYFTQEVGRIVHLNPASTNFCYYIAYPEENGNKVGLYITPSETTGLRLRCGFSADGWYAYRGKNWGYYELNKIIGVHRISG